MIKSVIFDLFDTLIHIDWNKYNNFRRELSDFIDTPVEDVRRIWRKYRTKRCTGEIATLKDMIKILIKELGKEAEDGNLEKMVEMERKTLKESVVFYPDVDIMLDKLKAGGYELGLLSNASPNSKPVIEMLPWMNYFDHVILSYWVGMVKPDPRIYILMTGRMGLPADECLFVGDGGSMELDGAKKVGMITVKAAQENQDADEIRSENADYIVESVREIPDLVERINRERK